jgi:acetyltransferase-like isoleucine patch superfamily enzyme
MKGAKIDDDCIVASNSVITKHLEGEHQLIAGIPAKVVRTAVTWEY